MLFLYKTFRNSTKSYKTHKIQQNFTQLLQTKANTKLYNTLHTQMCAIPQHKLYKTLHNFT